MVTIPRRRPGPRGRRRGWRPVAPAVRGHEAPLRIGLYGLFGIENIGNDGSLEAMVRALGRLRPDAEIVCICGEPDNVRRDLDIEAVAIRARPPEQAWFRRVDRLLLRLPRVVNLGAQTIAEARRLDVMLIPGTGILEDMYDKPLGDPLSLLAWCVLAKAFGVRIGFASVGAGPMRNTMNRLLLKSAARMADYRSYRDVRTRDFLESIGVEAAGDSVAPDIVFGLPAPPDDRRSASEGEPLTVGLGVMLYHGWKGDDRGVYEDYLSGLAEFGVWLVRSGYRLRLLTGQYNDGWAVADLRVRMARLDGDLPEDRIVADPALSLHDLMRHIADTDVVVATRFHNVVCALKMDKPTLSVGYSKKNDALMTEMGLGAFCQEAERVDVPRLKAQFDALVADRQAYADRLRAGNAEIQRRLEEEEGLLVSRLLT